MRRKIMFETEKHENMHEIKICAQSRENVYAVKLFFGCSSLESSMNFSAQRKAYFAFQVNDKIPFIIIGTFPKRKKIVEG